MDVLRQGTKDFFKLVPYFVEAYYDNNRRIKIAEFKSMGLSLSNSRCNVIMTHLVRASILHAQKTGFLFLRDPKEISLLEVTRAIQGIPYAECSSVLHDKLGKDCPVCDAINSGIRQMADTLTNTSLYDYAEALKEVHNIDNNNEDNNENI